MAAVVMEQGTSKHEIVSDGTITHGQLQLVALREALRTTKDEPNRLIMVHGHDLTVTTAKDMILSESEAAKINVEYAHKALMTMKDVVDTEDFKDFDDLKGHPAMMRYIAEDSYKILKEIYELNAKRKYAVRFATSKSIGMMWITRIATVLANKLCDLQSPASMRATAQAGDTSA